MLFHRESAKPWDKKDKIKINFQTTHSGTLSAPVTYLQPIGSIDSVGELVTQGIEMRHHLVHGTTVDHSTRVHKDNFIEKSYCFRRRL